ncbi:hypothetical protein F0L74_27330 [Chitinophaga agrisoli]|uniref:Uncharacterized protein n=1 Tax=Chitinophaga agrisoli TaxID=2607653 RepID=A0A5B2VLF2_9BACT|nr:hypothetical protein [Chitinophaga agrisoli]KAA2239901.1 hypothetical protein F0L74_27330 [Chitinophaga agrisoli]
MSFELFSTIWSVTLKTISTCFYIIPLSKRFTAKKRRKNVIEGLTHTDIIQMANDHKSPIDSEIKLPIFKLVPIRMRKGLYDIDLYLINPNIRHSLTISCSTISGISLSMPIIVYDTTGVKLTTWNMKYFEDEIYPFEFGMVVNNKTIYQYYFEIITDEKKGVIEIANEYYAYRNKKYSPLEFAGLFAQP